MIPLDEMWIRDVDTIKVIADPRRLKILELMEIPHTVKQVAAVLNIDPSKLYYHINLLEKHNLIEVVDHNIDSGIVEKIYQTSAREFKLVNPLIDRDRHTQETAGALLTSMLDKTRQEFATALAAEGDAVTDPPRHPFFSKRGFRLTEEQLTHVHQRLVALIEEVTTLGAETNKETEPHYELTVVFYQHDPNHKEHNHG